MAEMLFGVETEYAVAGSNEAGPMGPEDVLRGLLNRAHKQLVHLPGLYSVSGVFLGNGARLYADCGNHPELCTPECSNPWDVVRYIQAGHRILAGLASGLEKECTPGTEILCFRGNVDYSGSNSTWGCHESYMHRCTQEELQPQIVPHLVTRPTYTGAGGFNPTVRGLQFTLSPRLAYFRLVETESSTGGRGIWHNKSESLCEGYGRLHVLCGESLCSETSTFLKIGVTALIVAMADAGLKPGKKVHLADPLEALRTVANDATCSKPLRMKDGKRRTAIEVQREYLKVAEANLGDGSLPDWAGEVCRKWREILDRLEGGTRAVEKTLDWAIKLALYERHARGWGIRWAELGFWSEFIGRCYEALGGRRGRGTGMTLAQAIEPGQLMPKELTALEPLMEARGLGWEDLRTLLKSREEFFAIDTRFGQIGPKGIFESLDAAGVLDHHVDGVERIEEAMTEPPAVGRARIRGEVIQRLAGKDHAQADWANVVDFNDGKALDLSDPFAREEVWEPLDQYEIRERQMSLLFDGFIETGSVGESSRHDQYSRRQEAFECYQAGNYAGAEALLRPLIDEDFEVASNRCHLARSLMLMDREGEARQEIEAAMLAVEGACEYVFPRLLFFKWMFAILNGGRTAAIARRMKAALRNPGSSSTWTVQPMIDYLRPRLGDENFRFLTALAEALSDERSIPRLDEFAQWRGRGVERNAA